VTTVHLVDLLDQAEIETPRPACVQVQPMEVGGEAALAIFEHPVSRIRFPLPPDLGAGQLQFACGVKSVAWADLRGPVTFRVELVVGGSVTRAFRMTLRPHTRPRDRRWVPGTVEVPAGATAVVLHTTARRRPGAAWAGWADPVLVFDPPSDPDGTGRRATGRPPVPATGVLIVTATACRADDVGPDNAHGISTPHLDALAADGVRFLDARANATSTSASQSVMLTGRHTTGAVETHEWCLLPAGVTSLPGEFARAGFRTVALHGKNVIQPPGFGPRVHFDDWIPAVGQPYQDGTVTTRALLRHLAAATGPQFVWIDFYDLHPPFLLTPAQMRGEYEGDPRDPGRSWRPDLVADYHGVGAIVELRDGLDLLRRGRVGKEFLIVLRDAAAIAVGTGTKISELGDHLVADARLRQGRSPAEMGAWLHSRCDRLADGEIDPDLLAWIEEALTSLHPSDLETLGAAREILDFRFVEAQARAAVRLLDDQVGILTDRLRAAGVYDDWTIVFTAPHGDLIGESGIGHSHYSPAEGALRVPLVVKPARSVGPLGTGSVRGVFDAVDLMPTLLEAHGLRGPAFDGRSRVTELRAGGDLPTTASFARDKDGVLACVTRGPHKLIRATGWILYDRAPIGPGESRLLRVDGSQERDDPDDRDGVRAELERALDEWLARH
jgi:arylsulfatase A-like enzyme